MNKNDLLLKKGQLVAEAKQIMDSARSDGREKLTKDEEIKFLAIHADVEDITRTIGLITKQEDAERATNEPGIRVTNAVQPGAHLEDRADSRLSKGSRDQHDAVRGWFANAFRSKGGATSEQRAAAQRVGLNIDANMMNFRLAGNALMPSGYCADGMRVTSEDLKRWQQLHDEERALAGPQSSTSVGGFTIQDAAMREIEIALLAFGGMRQVSTIIRTDTGGPLPIPTVNDTSNVGSLIGENTTATKLDVTFSQLVLDAFKYTSKEVVVSWELLQDNSVNLPQLLGRILGERLGRIMNQHFTTGTGTGQPNGVVTAATFTQAATGNTTGITFANLVALYHSVDPSYRGNARFMMNDNSLSKIKLLTDSQGRPLWLPGLVDRAPDTILGSPYVINQDVATMTATAKSILFGDFSKYWIRDVREFQMVRMDERYAEFLQSSFLAFLRTDGDLLNAGTNPIKGYQNST